MDYFLTARTGAKIILGDDLISEKGSVNGGI